MNLLDTFVTAITALVSNKLRSMLTMLGIIIGVAAVITLMSVGQGAQQDISERIRGLGSNLVFVRPGQTEGTGGPQPALTLVDTDSWIANQKA